MKSPHHRCNSCGRKTEYQGILPALATIYCQRCTEKFEKRI